MWNAIVLLLVAFGLLEAEHAAGAKPDWLKTLCMMAWITLFSLAASGVLIWGVEHQKPGWGIGGFLALMAAGFAAAAIVVWRWLMREKQRFSK